MAEVLRSSKWEVRDGLGRRLRTCSVWLGQRQRCDGFQSWLAVLYGLRVGRGKCSAEVLCIPVSNFTESLGSVGRGLAKAAKATQRWVLSP